MARIRTIKPEFFKNEKLAELSPYHRLLFIGLWTQSDREGRLEDRPKRLKAELFPYEDQNIDKMLDDLQDNGFIQRYKYKETGVEVFAIQIITFLIHQQPNIKEKPSTIQAPCKNGTSTKKNFTFKERKGKEGIGKGTEGVPIFSKKNPGESDLKNEDVLNEKKNEVEQAEILDHPIVEKIKKEFPKIQKLKTQLSNDQAEKLARDFPATVLQDVFEGMENHKNLLKNYESVYLTANNWAKKRIENAKSGKNTSEKKFGGLAMQDAIDLANYIPNDPPNYGGAKNS